MSTHYPLFFANTIHEAYHQVLRAVLYSPEFKSSPRGKAIHEITNLIFTVTNPTSESVKTFDTERNSVLRTYFEAEKALYESMSNSAEDFSKASTFWRSLANPDGTVNSAYGHLIWQVPSLGHVDFESERGGQGILRTPWEWAVSALKSDKDTRQAVLPFAMPHHYYQGNKDQVCTLQGTFHIRKSRLNLTMVMRSNDIVRGLAYDMPWFISLMDKMVDELRSVYPDLQKGSYTHLAHSAHMYLEDISKVRKMLGNHTPHSPQVVA